jgi:hypothetical protein
MKSFKRLVQLGVVLLLGSLLFVSCRKEVSPVTDPSSSPVATQLAPALGPSNTLLTLTGTGLGDIKTIVFDKDSVPAGFNPVFNTDGAIIFRVPLNAIPGPQNIVLTNGLGVKITIPFNVLGLVTILDVSNYNFITGSRLTLTGKNLDDVSKVTFHGSTQAVNVISKTATTLVIEMPATALYRTTLDITNGAGTVNPTQEFVSLTNNFKFFADGYENGEQDASWGDAGFVSTTEFKSGTSSFGKNFQAYNWHQMGFGWNNITNDNYKFLSFWMKGGSVDLPLWISTATSANGFASFNDNAKITVPAGKWTYFKIPLSDLNLWATGTGFNQIGWRIQGPGGDRPGSADGEKLYLDDVMLVK